MQWNFAQAFHGAQKKDPADSGDLVQSFMYPTELRLTFGILGEISKKKTIGWTALTFGIYYRVRPRMSCYDFNRVPSTDQNFNFDFIPIRLIGTL